MKRVVFPPACNVLLLLILWGLIALICRYILTELIPFSIVAISDLPVSVLIIIIVADLAIILTIILLVLLGTWYYLCYCRPVIWNDGSIQQGLFFPCRLSWEEKPRIGIATVVGAALLSDSAHVYMKASVSRFWEQSMIYLVSNEYSDSGLSAYGIGEVWLQKVINERFPVLAHISSKTRRRFEATKNDTKRQKWLWGNYSPAPELKTPKKMIWVTYTPQRYEKLTDLLSMK